MTRLLQIVGTALALISTPITAQTAISGRQVNVDGVRLDTALAAKADSATVASALATKVDSTAVSAAIAAASGKSSTLSVGFTQASPQIPSVTSFVVSPLASAPLVDYVAHLRQSVFVGDWTTRASVSVVCSGGTSAWTVGGQTATISCGASAATVQAALSGLSTVGATGVTVAGTSPYVVSYSPDYVGSGGLFTGKQLAVSGAGLTGPSANASLSWANMWGVDTGFLFAENSYHVTGASGTDGNGIAVMYGGLYEANLRSAANIGRIVGLTAETSFAGANSIGRVGRMTAMQVNSILHKDGSLIYPGTADEVIGLSVGGNQAARTFTDGVTNGTAAITSATAQFTTADVGKVVTGTNVAANSYVAAVTSTTLTLNKPTTGSGSGIAVTIAGTARCTVCLTARFGTGSVETNGQLSVKGWKDEPVAIFSGTNNQTSDLAQFILNGNKQFYINRTGNASSQSGFTAFEGNGAGQSALGYTNGPAKPGVSFGFPFDASIYRDGVGIIATGGGLRLGNNTAQATNATPIATGPRLFGGPGAPGTITGAALGDFYFRADGAGFSGAIHIYQYSGTAWVGLL